MAGTTGFFHHIGTFLLFAATILLIVTCISAPVVHDLSLLKVELGGDGSNRGDVTFGTFGSCHVLHDQDDDCSPSRLGYSPSRILSELDGTSFSDYASDTTRSLTKAMILHPIACGINFIAFLLALGAGMIGSFLASLVALLAFLTTAVACVIDFVLFSIVRSNVNDRGDDVTGTRAHYGPAAWTMLVSAICSLLGAVVVFFTCCSARLHKRRSRRGVVDGKGEFGSASPRRRRFW